jgi:hypothetical protein
MTVTSPRSIRLDQARIAIVVVLGIAQVALGAAGANGELGQRIGEVAFAYPTPLLAAPWAFGIWIPIYLGYLAYAGYQCFPRQRHRELHRRTGWWLAVSAVCNLLWILTWTSGLLLLAELLLIVLLISLAVVFGRLSREPATSTPERVAFRAPVAVYTGWMSIAIIMGTAATGVWVGLPGATAIASVAAVIVLAAVAAIGYAAAVMWALIAVVLNGPPVSVAVAVAIVLIGILGAAVRRLASSADPTRAAFG